MSRVFTLMERVLESALMEERQRLDVSLRWSKTIKTLLTRSGADPTEDVPPAALPTHRERREREQMADVKAALKRLDEGVYGRCELCDAPIELSSLLEVPWTRYCAGCLASGPVPLSLPSPMPVANLR